MKVSEIIRKATEFLRDSKVENARSEAELLTGFVLGWTRLQVMTRGEQEVNDIEYTSLCRTMKRRAAGEPYAYICGEKEFMSLPFKVTSDVLIPRPDTELLVETVLSYLRSELAEEGIQQQYVLDLCTGSGAIAVSLAYYLPGALIWAADVSERALAVAGQNSMLNGVADSIEFCLGDLFAALTEIKKDRQEIMFDCIVSNPPYIPDGDIPQLMRDVRDFEPELALAGGSDGLKFYRKITEQALDWLKPEGMLAVEIGCDQADAVQELFLQAGYDEIQLLADLAGWPRVITGIKKSR